MVLMRVSGVTSTESSGGFFLNVSEHLWRINLHKTDTQTIKQSNEMCKEEKNINLYVHSFPVMIWVSTVVVSFLSKFYKAGVENAHNTNVFFKVTQ